MAGYKTGLRGERFCKTWLHNDQELDFKQVY